jgi:hypothetical protein
VSTPVDPKYIPNTEQVKAAYMKMSGFFSNVPEKIEYELGFEAWLDSFTAEVTRLRKAIKLFNEMPINSGGSSREPEVSLDLINWTKAMDVAEGRDDPDNWVNEPCKNATGHGPGTFRFEHSPHHWNDYEEFREPHRIAHWCNGELV